MSSASAEAVAASAVAASDPPEDTEGKLAAAEIAALDMGDEMLLLRIEDIVNVDGIEVVGCNLDEDVSVVGRRL